LDRNLSGGSSQNSFKDYLPNSTTTLFLTGINKSFQNQSAVYAIIFGPSNTTAVAQGSGDVHWATWVVFCVVYSAFIGAGFLGGSIRTMVSRWISLGR